MPLAAFTLLETCVVIAVMAVLLTLLFPFFKEAYSRALQTACMNNLRSYGNAYFAYIADYGTLPLFTEIIDPKTEKVTEKAPDFSTITLEYLNRKEPLRCPQGRGEDKGFGYGINASLAKKFPHLVLPVPRSRVVFAAERNGNFFSSFGHFNRTIWANNNGSAGDEGSADPKNYSQKPQYHGTPEKRGLHLMFLDAHIQLVFPVENDWSKPPVYGPSTTAEAKNNPGYFYSDGQFNRMASGALAIP